ncbi:hypothetical protein FRB98_001221 [Tulasnella sp. 332]|nr:hypothetical protein FRB98_001221 [Tulasnella sp. 332]
MSSGDDEFDALLADTNLTIEDLAVIDAACFKAQQHSALDSNSVPLEEPGPAPAIPDNTTSKSSKGAQMRGTQTRILKSKVVAARSPSTTITPNPSSLLSLFRKGRLTVTDLVTPSWCEVKFDYSLRGQRWKGAKMDSFVVSKHGKKIPVKKTIVVEAEKVMKKGQAVHKKLEEALPTFEIVVEIRTAEEKLGLEMLNMISNLQMLTTNGRCREFRVMGFINGVMIVGIIDEIVRKAVEPLIIPRTPPPLSHSPKRINQDPPTTSEVFTKKRQKGKGNPNQQTLDAFFTVASSPLTSRQTRPPASQTSDMDVDTPASSQGGPSQGIEPGSSQTFVPTASQESAFSQDVEDVEQPVHYRLHVNDTKTRSEPTLPKDDLSGRLQLMLYYRLLGAMLTPSKPVLTPDPSQNAESSQQSSTSNEVATSSSRSPRVTFSFQDLFFQRQLMPDRQFSDIFIAQAMEIIHVLPSLASSPKSSRKSPPPIPNSLNGMVAIWWQTVQSLALEPLKGYGGNDDDGLFVGGPIDPMLELVYHRRKGLNSGRNAKKRKGKGKKADQGEGSVETKLVADGMTEEEQIGFAIQESLKPLVQDHTKRASTPSSPPRDENLPAANVPEPPRAPESPRTPPASTSPGTARIYSTPAIKPALGKTRSTASPTYPWHVFNNHNKSTRSNDTAELEPDIEVLEQDAAVAVCLSQTSALEWDRALGESLISESELLAVDIPVMVPVVASGRDSQEGVVHVKSSQDMDLDTPEASQQREDLRICEAPLARTFTISAPDVTAPLAIKAATRSHPAPPSSRGPNLPNPIVNSDLPSTFINGSTPPISNALATFAVNKSSEEDAQIIGRTRFPFSAAHLDVHLKSALEFWAGSREPRGVDLEDTWKCNSCEYMEECEWREAKANAPHPSKAA